MCSKTHWSAGSAAKPKKQRATPKLETILPSQQSGAEEDLQAFLSPPPAPAWGLSTASSTGGHGASGNHSLGGLDVKWRPLFAGAAGSAPSPVEAKQLSDSLLR